MKAVSSLTVALLIVAFVLVIVIFILPLGAEARDDQPNLFEELGVRATGLFGGESNDVQLTSQGGRLPEVAANGTFVAVVYEQSNNVFLRAAQTKWGFVKQLDTTNKGNVPTVTTKRFVHRVDRHFNCLWSIIRTNSWTSPTYSPTLHFTFWTNLTRLNH